jgi:tRNA(Arg) A34 adenosine deaminase TadA
MGSKVSMARADLTIAARFLDVIENDVLALTEVGVAGGNKVFGAAILRKSDLSLVVAGTNSEVENPLFHGEIATLNAFYKIDTQGRPRTADCLFLSTHEPCSLCLSAITWAGFDNFFYLFGYETTRDVFKIPHDLRILSEVFRIENGGYARRNAFWTARSIGELAGDDPVLGKRMTAIRARYDALSAVYQASKVGSDIPLN